MRNSKNTQHGGSQFSDNEYASVFGRPATCYLANQSGGSTTSQQSLLTNNGLIWVSTWNERVVWSYFGGAVSDDIKAYIAMNGQSLVYKYVAIG